MWGVGGSVRLTRAREVRMGAGIEPIKGSWAAEALSAIARAPSVDEVWAALVVALAGFGFDRVNYGLTFFLQGRNVGAPEDVLYLSNRDAVFRRAYFGSGLYAETPMYDWISKHEGACSWRMMADAYARRELTEKQRQAVEKMNKLGSGAGYSISFPSASSRVRGAIGLCAKAELSQDDVDAIWEQEGDLIFAVCTLAHARIVTLPLPVARMDLTARQREVLNWISDGKSLQDVCVLMGLSLSAVEKHLKSARARLDVETTAQAVAKLAFFNQLFISERRQANLE